MAERIQLRRTFGYRKPREAVFVARPSKWSNPYRLVGERWVVGPDGFEHYCAPGEQRGVAVRLFREDLYSGRLSFMVDDVRRELAGKDLCCWCKTTEPCHADTLLAIANES